MPCNVGEIEYDLTKMKKNFTYKVLVVALEKTQDFLPFFQTYLHFPDFFQVWKTAGEISRLFQEFETLRETCTS